MLIGLAAARYGLAATPRSRLGLAPRIRARFVRRAFVVWQQWGSLLPVEMPRSPLVIGAAGDWARLQQWPRRLRLSRWSLRSLAATVMLMAMGALTEFAMRHWLA